MSITTKKGDTGLSFLFSGERVKKNALRLETYGCLDELVSVLSIARHHVQEKETKENILYLQRQLFVIGSELATSPKGLSRLKIRIDQSALEFFDQKRITLESQTPIPRGFVIPGNSLGASYIDYARAISRRLERFTVSLKQKKELTNPYLLVWLNRLSDYLYLLARKEERKPLLVKDIS